MQVLKTHKETINFATGDTTKDITLSGFTTLSQCMLMSISVQCGTNTAQIAQVDFDADLTSLTNITVSRGVSGVACTVIIYVAEFKDAVVQKDTWSLGTGDTSTSITLGDTVTMANAFTVFTRKCTTGSTLQPNASNVHCELTTTSNVAIAKNTAGGAHSGHVYTLEHSDLSVQRGSQASSTITTTITISSVTLANAFCICSNSDSGTQYEDEGNGFLRLATATTCIYQTGYASSSSTIKWQVVEDSDFSVQRFYNNSLTTASGTLTLTSVDTDFTVAMPGAKPGSFASSLYNNAGDMNNRCVSYDISSATACDYAKFTGNGSYGVDVVEFTEYVPSGPAITNCGDEDHYIGETGITITGTTFEADGANSRVRIDSSSAGTGTSQTQIDTSWSDTSIDFTASLGSLNYGTNYIFVRNDSENENETGYAINLYQNILTTGLNDTTFYDGQTGIEIDGSGFGSSQGSSELYLSSASDASGTNVVQTITSWTDTKITFTVDIGALSLGTVYAIIGRNSSSLGDSSERLSPSQTATLINIPVVPVITDIEDEQLTDEETEVLIDGTGFGATQGSGKVELCASAVYGSPVLQIVTGWSDLQIEITVVRGSLGIGANYMFVTNDDGETSATGYYINLVAAASSDGLYQSSSFQITITSTGMSTTAFLIKDE